MAVPVVAAAARARKGASAARRARTATGSPTSSSPAPGNRGPDAGEDQPLDEPADEPADEGQPPGRSGGSGGSGGPRRALSAAVGAVPRDGAGVVLGFLVWVWVVLPYLDGGVVRVKQVLAAKFANQGPNGQPLP